MKNKTYYFLILSLVLLLLFIANIVAGTVKIPIENTLEILAGIPNKKSWEYIIIQYRLPKALVAIFVGIALSIVGMLMQTMFRNPMADAYVLGISSGSSLGVALVLMGASILPMSIRHLVQNPYSTSISAIIGSLLIMNIVIIVAKKFSDTNTLLIVGLMFSSFASAFVSILAYFSTAEELQRYTFWSMGNLGNVSWQGIILLGTSVAIAIIVTIKITKNLNAMLLGQMYAQTLGIDTKKTKNTIVWISCILCGISTAIVGPIAFIGLAVPHISRILCRTHNHFILLISNIFIGSALLLLCDLVSQLPSTSIVLPINAITSIIGAPIVIYLLLKKH